MRISKKDFRKRTLTRRDMMEIYHFSNEVINEFRFTKPKRDYSQASGNGIYFTTSFEKGSLKYGQRSKFCYVCNFSGNVDSILNLGEFDAMYFDGRKVHAAYLVSENFKRIISGIDLIKEPEICIENISGKAFKWLKSKGFSAIYGMQCEGYACPEFCVLDPQFIAIKDIVKYPYLLR